MITPDAVARSIALRNVLSAADPPSEMFTTFARAFVAAFSPAAMALSLWLQPPSVLPAVAVAQLPGVSVRSANKVASNATP